MKTKTAGNPRSAKLLKAVHSVSTLLRKKKPKHLAPKKTVRFNLMVRSSSSEVMLKPVHLMKPDLDKGLELRSRSCVDVTEPGVLCRSHDAGPLTSLVHESSCQSQAQFRVIRMRSLQKYIKCFNDLYLLEPVLNLQRKVPVRGILKNMRNCWNTYRNHEETPSPKKRLLTFAGVRDSKTCCHSSSTKSYVQPPSVFKSQPNNESTNSSEVVKRNIFENLTASIQGLHISAPCPGDQGRKAGVITKGKPRCNFVPSHPQNNSQLDCCQGLIRFFGP